MPKVDELGRVGGKEYLRARVRELFDNPIKLAPCLGVKVKLGLVDEQGRMVLKLQPRVGAKYGDGEARLNAHSHVRRTHLNAGLAFCHEDLERLVEIPRVVGIQVDSQIVRRAIELMGRLLLHDPAEFAHEIGSVLIFDREEDLIANLFHSPLESGRLADFLPVGSRNGFLIEALIEFLEHPPQ